MYLFPSVVGFGTSYLCPIGKAAGSTVKFRPPAAAFPVIWVLLYNMLGLSFVLASRSARSKMLCTVLYACTAFLLAAWIYAYGCMKSPKFASWVMILVVASSLATFTQGDEISKILLCPLISWALYAMMMNTTEVQQT